MTKTESEREGERRSQTDITEKILEMVHRKEEKL